MLESAPLSEKRQHRTSLLWYAVLAVLAILLVLDLSRVWRMTNHHDLDVFLVAARRLSDGADIYVDAAPFKESIENGSFSMRDASVVWPYAYAPTIAILLRPVLALPLDIVRAGWWTLNVFAIVAGSLVTARSVIPLTPGRVALVLVLLIRFQPAVVTLRLGQIELVQYLLLSLALFALTRLMRHRAWDRTGGLALGVASALKFFPGALAVLILWRRRWRPAAWSIGVALGLTTLSFAAVGWHTLGAYMAFSRMYGIGEAFAAFPLNQSLNGFFSRNLIHNVFGATLRGWHLPALATGLAITGSLLVVALSAWLTWHRDPWPVRPTDAHAQVFALEYGLGIAALLIISPHSQVYTYVWTLIPLISLSMLLGDLPLRSTWWQWCFLAIAYLLIGRDLSLVRPGLTRFVQAHYLGGALLLWVTVSVELGLRRWTRRPIRTTARPKEVSAPC